MIVQRLFLCPEHVYVGHFGGPAGKAPMREVTRARAIAGRGLFGDRYCEREPGHRGQVTFFSEEVCLRLAEDLGRPSPDPEVFRRNIVVRDGDLSALVGKDFEVQGLRFRGTEYCKPCFWMDEAFGAGTLERLSAWHAGGLRAAVLTDGWLRAPGAVEA